MIASADIAVAAGLAPVNVQSRRVADVFDPSWSVSEKRVFIRALGTLAPEALAHLTEPLRISAAEAFDQTGVPHDVFSPRLAAAQVVGELIARPRFIPSAVDSVRQSNLPEAEDATVSLEAFSAALRRQAPSQRKIQLHELSELRRQLYARDLNSGDLILWMQNHLNAVVDLKLKGRLGGGAIVPGELKRQRRKPYRY